MKKIFTLSAIIALCSATVMFTGCQTEALDTAQYSAEKVTLASYGPNPVMRGGALTFIGSNLDKIKEVQIPGVSPITSIDVIASGFQSEIRVQIPAEGPQVGKIVLTASDGTVITTLSNLEYSEPIVFDSFSPASAMPGDVLSLQGDYMNLVTKVEFAGGAIAEVIPVDRHNAKVIVPADAVTGMIIVSDDNEIPNRIYSETELEIGDPSVNSIDALWKKGEIVTVTGEHLEMIKEVRFAGAIVSELEIAEDGNTLTFVLPAEAQSGEAVAISYAGKEFGTTEVEMVLPSDLAAAPQPVKAGSELVITGKDLDLVTGIDFDGAADASFLCIDDQITVSVPETAKEGNVTLKLDNGSSVAVAFTLVVPAITNITPAEVYGGDDVPVTVEGSDLDLVKAVKLNGKNAEFELSGEAIEIKVEATHATGKVTLVLANGTEVVSDQDVTVLYHSLVIVTSIPSAQHIGQEVVIQGNNLSLVENIFIGSTKVTQYSLRTDNELRFLVPWCPVGSYELNFNLFNGDVETQPAPFEVLLEQVVTTIWEGEFTIGGWDRGFQNLSWGGYDWSQVAVGTNMTVYFTPYVGDYDSQIRFGNGSWAALPSTTGLGADGNWIVSQDVSYYSFNLTADDLDQLVNAGGLVLCGAWYTVNKIVLATDIPQEKTVWEGSEALVAWENHDSYAPDNLWGPAGVYEGAEVKIYLTISADDWMVQLFGPHWQGFTCGPNGGQQFKQEFCPTAAADGYISFKVDADLCAQLLDVQGWGAPIILQGQGCTVTKITVK